MAKFRNTLKYTVSRALCCVSSWPLSALPLLVHRGIRQRDHSAYIGYVISVFELATKPADECCALSPVKAESKRLFDRYTYYQLLCKQAIA